MRSFEVKTSREHGTIRLALSGELDISSAPRAEDALRRAEDETPQAIVLDLRNLTFMDSTGLRIVVSADQRAREAGRRFAVVQGPGAIQRVFEITRLGERLDIVADPAEL